MRAMLRTSILSLATIVGVPTLSLAVQHVVVALDAGMTVDVFYTDGLDENRVRSLVLVADRSTQEDCPYSAPNYKGLFKYGDRIFVSNNYLAWFDFSAGDGVTFPFLQASDGYSPQANTFTRGGALAGWWTLNPVAHTFKYFRTGPHGDGTGGCGKVWPHNELIPGSASPNPPNSGELLKFWWDEYGPPMENTISVVAPTGNVLRTSTFYSLRIPQHFSLDVDGLEDSAGVHFKTTMWMTGVNGGNGSFTDIEDGDDANGVLNHIDAEVEYVCSANGIKVIWKFSPNDPSREVEINQAYVLLWSAYGQDEDNPPTAPQDPDHPCDVAVPGSQWPDTTYGRPMYNQSSMALVTSGL